MIHKSIEAFDKIKPILNELKDEDLDEVLHDIIFSYGQKLTCFNCGEMLDTPIDNILGILHFDGGERNYPHSPDEPATIFFECAKCKNKKELKKK